MSKISREVESNNRDWAKSSGPNVNIQRSFPERSATQPKDPPEFLGPTGADARDRQ